MNISPVGNQNCLYLNSLRSDLVAAEKSGHAVFLKVVGDGRQEHVEVVKGLFWNFVAKIACYFGVGSYSLQNISDVFQKQLNRLESSYCDELIPKTKQALREAGMRVTKVFIRDLVHHGHILNREIPKDKKALIIEKVRDWKRHFVDLDQGVKSSDDLTAVFSASIFESPASSALASNKDLSKLELDRVLAHCLHRASPSLSEMLHVDLGETIEEVFESLRMAKTTPHKLVEQLEQLTKPLYDIGIRYPATTQGGLAHSAYNSIVERLYDLKRVIETPLPATNQGKANLLCLLEQSANTLTEAKLLLTAFQAGDDAIVNAPYAKKAVLLLELRALLRKVENIALPQHSFADSSFAENVKKGLPLLVEDVSKLYDHLDNLAESELLEAFNKIKTELKPLSILWDKKLGIPEVAPRQFALPLNDLVEEWEAHFAELQKAKSKTVEYLPLLENKLKRAQEAYNHTSLAYSAYEKAVANVRKPTFEQVERHLPEVEMLALKQETAQGKRARGLFVLREFLAFAQKHVNEIRPKANAAERKELAAAEKKIQQFQKALGLDAEGKAFSRGRLQSITSEELEALGSSLFDHLNFLSSSQKIRADLHWKALSRHRREFKSLVLDLT